MRTLIQKALAMICLWVFSHSAFAEEQLPQVEVAFTDSGFMVQAPASVTQLELRVVNPKRIEVFEQRTDGADIDWNLQGTESDGEYRFEAVSVFAVDGELKQRNTGGGFEIQSGVLIAPPNLSKFAARHRSLKDGRSEEDHFADSFEYRSHSHDQ